MSMIAGGRQCSDKMDMFMLRCCHACIGELEEFCIVEADIYDSATSNLAMVTAGMDNLGEASRTGCKQ